MAKIIIAIVMIIIFINTAVDKCNYKPTITNVRLPVQNALRQVKETFQPSSGPVGPRRSAEAKEMKRKNQQPFIMQFGRLFVFGLYHNEPNATKY